ncbi:MAG: D-alanyl-D-alanine carboxypeptidase [Rhizobiales bacterium]|nr:D-alanyl-D-alanine carboxypeptidase [Hyphomicrobiales bacterium]
MVLLAIATGAAAQDEGGYDAKDRQAILIEVDTGAVLYQKEADTPAQPANMAKLMTMAVVFKALKEGRLSLDDQFVVSETAWRQGGAPARGTTMFAELGSSIRVEDLIRGVIIQSANDGCIVLAEGMTGSQEAFVKLMNEEAQRLGLANSRFTNVTGLPDPGQAMSVRDIATLTAYLIREFPEFYKIYAEPEFTWNKIRQLNRNPLLSLNIGADGLVTGSTEDSGFGLAGSTVQNGQRLIIAVNGADSDKARADEARKLVDWGYREFQRVELFGAGDVIAEARVFNGAQSRVGLVSKAPVEFLMPQSSRVTLRAEVVYEGPLPAPVTAGREVGYVRISTTEGMETRAPVYTNADVGVGSLAIRALDGLEELLLGWW